MRGPSSSLREEKDSAITQKINERYQRWTREEHPSLYCCKRSQSWLVLAGTPLIESCEGMTGCVS